MAALLEAVLSMAALLEAVLSMAALLKAVLSMAALLKAVLSMAALLEAVLSMAALLEAVLSMAALLYYFSLIFIFILSDNLLFTGQLNYLIIKLFIYLIQFTSGSFLLTIHNFKCSYYADSYYSNGIYFQLTANITLHL